MPLRIGVIGCGRMAQQFHLPSLQYLQTVIDSVEVAWCSDLDTERAKAAADMLGAEARDDFKVALSQHPVDACIVLVQVAQTFEVVAELLRRNVPVFTEKPPGANLDQSRQLAELASKNATRSQVGFNRRHNPHLAKAFEHIGGRKALASVTYEMFRVRRQEAEFPAYTMIHAIDAMRYIGGDPVEWTLLQHNKPRAWSYAISFDSGVVGTLAVYPQGGLNIERCTLHAADRSAVVTGLHSGTADGLGYADLYHRNQPIRREAADPAIDPVLQPAAAAGFVNQMKSFLQNLAADRPLQPDLPDALKTMQWIDQILSRLHLTWPT